jgi:hypothetical protein
VSQIEQVVAFIAKAHELGRSELALAQALQFEGTLRQIDVIGEWLPDPERRSGMRAPDGKAGGDGLSTRLSVTRAATRAIKLS